jgi:hypothetical protein
MKDKAQILGRLLKEKAIDEEELVILLGELQNVQYIPYPVYPVNPYPFYPHFPQLPIYPIGPTIC